MDDTLKEKSLALLRTAIGNPEAEFRKGQWEIIEQLVREKAHLLVVQRTGWGKSFVYFIATKLLRDQDCGPTLLVSPLLALMRNQIAAAERFGLAARTINSSNHKEWEEVYRELGENKIDILLISPERLSNDDFRDNLLPIAQTIGLFVIDEAHCISDWGHDFRPDYQRIVRILQALPENVALLAITATANNRVIEDIRSQLGDKLGLFRGPLARASLSLQAISLPSQAERMAWLAENIPKMEGSGIVYTLTIRDSERVARWLRHKGINAAAYSSETDTETRPDLENALIGNTVKALVATSALGMGFDKPDLGFVIHYQRPGSIIAYYQQVGRAGRALEHAYGILLAGDDDKEIVDYFIESAFPKEAHVKMILKELEKADDGLSVHMLEERTNLSHAQIEKVFRLISVETPAPVIKEGSRYFATPIDYTINKPKIERLTTLRQTEWQQINDYMKGERCLMMFLQIGLEDPAAAPCGKCSVCMGRPLFPEKPSEELVTEARSFLYTNYHDIQPRLQWPSGVSVLPGEWSKRIPKELQAGPGVALSEWGDGGWGELVKTGKRDGHFDNYLVRAMCDLIVNRWKPDPMPAWVTCVPSLRKRTLVKNFAGELAQQLGLPFVDCITKIRETELQKLMKNSAQQVRNLNGAFEIDESKIRDGPVLLVDDMVDSRWTFTILAAMLRYAGTGPVFPCALTDTRSKDVL